MADTVIANSTYIEHVRHFFEDVDLEHMFKRGYDLTTYPTLKANEQAVIDQTRHPRPPCRRSRNGSGAMSGSSRSRTGSTTASRSAR